MFLKPRNTFSLWLRKYGHTGNFTLEGFSFWYFKKRDLVTAVQ
jgi:hypothetical protein